MNYQKELPELTELSITSSNQFFKDVQNLHQDKTSMDVTLNKVQFLTFTCWNEKYQPLTIDMTKVKYTGRYRLGFNFFFVPNANAF